MSETTAWVILISVTALLVLATITGRHLRKERERREWMERYLPTHYIGRDGKAYPAKPGGPREFYNHEEDGL